VLRGLAPDAFERLAQRILREAGFIKVEVTGRSGDGGIDGIGVLRVNLLSFHVLFQCKRYQSSVGAGAIRDFRGAMVGRSDKGVIITTGTFTPDAKREATRDGAPAIDLIDGDQLCDLLKDLKLGVHTEMVQRVKLEPGWFDDLWGMDCGDTFTRGRLPQQGDRRGPGRRRQGDHGTDERRARRPPMVPSQGIAMAADDQQ
jgi:restriction system protein